MNERSRWSVGITLVVLGVALGVLTLVLVRYTDLSARPWGYLGFALAVVGAVAGMLLGILRAHDVSDEPG